MCSQFINKSKSFFRVISTTVYFMYSVQSTYSYSNIIIFIIKSILKNLARYVALFVQLDWLLSPPPPPHSFLFVLPRVTA